MVLLVFATADTSMQGRRHGGTGGNSPPHSKGQFCESSKTDEKIWGMGGGDVTNHIQFLLESIFFYADRFSKFDFLYSLACPNMQKSDFAILSIEFSLQTFPTLSEVIYFYYVIQMYPESIRQVAKVASPVVA